MLSGGSPWQKTDRDSMKIRWSSDGWRFGSTRARCAWQLTAKIYMMLGAGVVHVFYFEDCETFYDGQECKRLSFTRSARSRQLTADIYMVSGAAAEGTVDFTDGETLWRRYRDVRIRLYRNRLLFIRAALSGTCRSWLTCINALRAIGHMRNCHMLISDF